VNRNYVNRCAEASGISTPFRIPSFRKRIKYRIPIFCSHDEMIYRTMIRPLREKYLYLGNCENGILRTSLDTRGSVMLPRVDMIFARHTITAYTLSISERESYPRVTSRTFLPHDSPNPISLPLPPLPLTLVRI